jgi:uncharacterized protein with GYD domain
MPKYLFQAKYTADGMKGRREKAVGRKQAVSNAVEALGGRFEAFYIMQVG